MPWFGWLALVVYAAGFHAGLETFSDAPFWQMRVLMAATWPYCLLVRIGIAALGRHDA